MKFRFYENGTFSGELSMQRVLPASFVHFRPRSFGNASDTGELARSDWPSLQNIMEGAQEEMDTVSKRDVFRRLGRFMTSHPPTTAAERNLTVTVDIYNIVHRIGEQEALLLAGRVDPEPEPATAEQTASAGGGGAGAAVPTSTSGSVVSVVPSGKPPHIVYKEQQKRLKEQQERQKKLARLRDKQKRMAETVAGLTKAIVAQKTAEFEEEKKRNQQQLEIV